MLEQFSVDEPTSELPEESLQEENSYTVDHLSKKQSKTHLPALESDIVTEEVLEDEEAGSMHVHGPGNKEHIAQDHEHDYMSDKKPKRVWNLQRQL